MHWNIPLLLGTLKVKTIQYMRRCELERRVPTRQIGSLYFIWWRKGLDPRSFHDH